MSNFLRVIDGRVERPPEARYDSLSTRSLYSTREANWGNEAIKQPVRERVLRYFLDVQPPDGKPARVFGLAGLHWQFEQQWLAVYGKNASAFAVERDYQTWAKSLGWMPGLGKRRHDLPLVSGSIEHAATDRASSLWMELRTFVGIGRMEWHSKSDGNWFRRSFKDWSAAWLDYNGDWDSRKAETLQRLGNCYDMRREVAPLAITLQIGRGEDPGTERGLPPAERRLRAILKVLNQTRGRRYEHDEMFVYKSAGGVDMMVTLGRLVRVPDTTAP